MKTKIVATIGPASSSHEMLKELIISGVSVFRLNFSHSSYEEHEKVIQSIRELNRELKTYTAILADLQGPKIRIGIMEDGSQPMVEGSEAVFTIHETICTKDRLYITYPEFARDVSPGEDILLDDGKLLFRVMETNGVDEVRVKVMHGGKLSSKKGVNLPNTRVSLPSLTEKDRKDLQFALSHGVNWIALSFVRTADDIHELRRSIEAFKGRDFTPGIIAKIEKPEAVRNIKEIIEAADGIMVARGDLGVELPLEQVPLVQKTITANCNAASKPVIIATQMMEGMISNIRPTRAEVNDVANSVLDGADAVMLSGETSVGQFPVEVIRTMKRIIGEVEEFQNVYDKRHLVNLMNKETIISDSILFATCTIANESGARAIVAMTRTGYSAYRISSQRPRQDIFILSGDKDLLCKLNLVWGINAIYFDEFVQSTSTTFRKITDKLIAMESIHRGDLLVYVASAPVYKSGKTNTIKLSYA